jgi:hypothetical protein
LPEIAWHQLQLPQTSISYYLIHGVRNNYGSSKAQ